MNRRQLFRATLGGLILPAVTERVRAYSFVGGWNNAPLPDLWCWYLIEYPRRTT